MDLGISGGKVVNSAYSRDVFTFRVHLTNIAGAGAVQLVSSLLPCLEKVKGSFISDVYLPDRGELRDYRVSNGMTRSVVFRRFLPNSISRVLECLFGQLYFPGNGPLLVLGDLPIRTNAKQVVFVQNSLLLELNGNVSWILYLKYYLMKLIFRANLNYVSAVVVQSERMKRLFCREYFGFESRISVISQPPPVWLVNSGLKRKGAVGLLNRGLRLFYPAAYYPHKNFSIFGKIVQSGASDWPVEEICLTIDQSLNPNPKLSWIECVGKLSEGEMIDRYANADGLIFLSKEESYGFPLLEAMFIGLPIICPDEPYASSMCGPEAIYFKVDDPNSLREAVVDLNARLLSGWWPDWSGRISSFPLEWQQVANSMVSVLR